MIIRFFLALTFAVNCCDIKSFQKFFGSLTRRQLNSLADYIEDSTVHQGKMRKVLFFVSGCLIVGD